MISRQSKKTRQAPASTRAPTVEPRMTTGMPTALEPAAIAACTPRGESSKTSCWRGSIPMIEAVFRKTSGAGLSRLTCSRRMMLSLQKWSKRPDPSRSRPASCSGVSEPMETEIFKPRTVFRKPKNPGLAEIAVPARFSL